jgi:hypothetical protein
MKTIVHCFSSNSNPKFVREFTTLSEKYRPMALSILLLPDHELLERCAALGLLCVQYEEKMGKAAVRSRLFEKILKDLDRIYTVEVLHFHGGTLFLASARRSLPGARILFAPLGAGDTASGGRGPGRKLVRSLTTTADLVLAGSEVEKERFTRAGYPESRTRVVEEGAPPEILAAIYGLS